MITVNPKTKEAQGIISLFKDDKWSNKGSIYEAYGRPSATKVAVWNDIVQRAANTQGYNHDIRVTSCNTYRFSTMYSYTNDEGTFIIYDTPSYTKQVKMEEDAE